MRDEANQAPCPQTARSMAGEEPAMARTVKGGAFFCFAKLRRHPPGFRESGRKRESRRGQRIGVRNCIGSRKLGTRAGNCVELARATAWNSRGQPHGTRAGNCVELERATAWNSNGQLRGTRTGNCILYSSFPRKRRFGRHELHFIQAICSQMPDQAPKAQNQLYVLQFISRKTAFLGKTTAYFTVALIYCLLIREGPCHPTNPRKRFSTLYSPGSAGEPMKASRTRVQNGYGR